MPQRHPLDRAEEIDQHRHVVAPAVRPDDVLEQHRRPALGQEAGLDLGHLEMGADRRCDPHEPALALEALDEVA